MNATTLPITNGSSRRHLILGTGLAFAAALIAGGITGRLFWPVVAFGGVMGLVLATIPAAHAAQRLMHLGFGLLNYAILLMALMMFSGPGWFLDLGWPTITGNAATQLTMIASALGLGGVILTGLGLTQRR